MPEVFQPRHSVLIVMCLMLAAIGGAQEQGCADVHALKKSTYNFRPTKLTQQQQVAKQKQINHFWETAEAQGERGISCLRGMLKSETADSFFLFDAASLLLHLDDSGPSLAAVSDAVERSDLGEINAAGYVELVMELAEHGLDTGALAEKYIRSPKVDGYVAEHSFPLDRATGGIFLYASMPPERADKYLVPLLRAKESYVRGTAALLLALNMTRESYRALARLPGLEGLPDTARKQVVAALAYHAPVGRAIPTYSRERVLARLRELPRTAEQMEAELKKERPVIGIAHDEPFLRSATATLTAADLDTVRQARRAALMSVSDESLYEYAAYTQIILGVINRLDLYSEYRVH
jgi:hypothetical protein